MAYSTPTASEFKTRYPAFTAVPDQSVDAIIAEAALSLDDSWPSQARYTQGVMLLTAHKLSLAGLGTSTETALAGIKSLSVGSLSLTAADGGAGASAFGEIGSTSYGREYRQLVRILFPGVLGV